MKKTFTRIFAIAIAAMMIAIMVPFTAFAAGGGLKLKTSNANFKFDVYKIADVDDMGGITVVATNDAALNTLIEKRGSEENTAAIVAKCEKDATAGTLATKLETFNPTSTADSKEYAGKGFYFIKPVYKGTGTALVMKSMLYIVASNETEEFTVKAAKINDGQPTITKKITDADSKDFDTVNGEYATGQLNDVIEYTLNATVPGSATNPIAKYNIVDTYEAGITPDLTKANVTVKLNGTATDDFTITTGTGTFTIVMDPKLFATGTYDYTANPSAAVEVVFNATVNADATLGNDSNDNEDKLVYRNKYKDDGSTETVDDGSDDTPLDGPTVQVFCFGLKAVKVDGSGNPLKGATFQLTGPSGFGPYTTVSADATGEVWFKNVPVSSANLGAGNDRTYKVVETAAPSGYLLNKSVFSITLPALNVAPKTGVTDKDGASAVFELGTVTAPEGWNFDKTTGVFSLAKDIVNPKIFVPETGGAGTWMFTLGGAALILIAGAMFIVIKKKGTSK